MTSAKSDNVVMLHRENVGNRLNFFDKTFAEYEEGFEANGKLFKTLLNGPRRGLDRVKGT